MNLVYSLLKYQRDIHMNSFTLFVVNIVVLYFSPFQQKITKKILCRDETCDFIRGPEVIRICLHSAAFQGYQMPSKFWKSAQQFRKSERG